MRTTNHPNTHSKITSQSFYPNKFLSRQWECDSITFFYDPKRKVLGRAPHFHSCSTPMHPVSHPEWNRLKFRYHLKTRHVKELMHTEYGVKVLTLVWYESLESWVPNQVLSSSLDRG
ncbi:hypothetical protein TNCV_3370681 [Trichonephila clavipes]|nr:hypothetical protein TNCV_3370681 [Trichonephila clavipes]